MKRSIVLAALLALLVGLVIGALLLPNGLTCKEWKDRYRDAASQREPGGVLDHINQGPAAERLAQLAKERPDDCPTSDA